MQLQIECNHEPSQPQFCFICQQWFETLEAKVLICNERGNNYGEVCPKCVKKGFNWLNDRFEQLSQPKRKVAVRSARSLEIPLGA